jgi:ribosomal protein S18 acetylase RimI-like enzyme
MCLVSLVIRRYQPEDADAVWSLHVAGLRQLGIYAPGPWEDDLRDVEGCYLSAGEFLVGFIADELVAMGGLRMLRPGVGEIKRMRVRPDLQGRGLGRAMLLQLERRAHELGVRELRLDTTPQQEAAIGLYRAHGYTEVGRETNADFELISFTKRLPSPKPTS